jgi:predicted nuclease of predicted toxin-antitoxin system
MRFVVDNQLAPSLSRLLAEAGHDSVHVAMVGLDAASDEALWSWATREERIVVSKDEDLFFLANRGGNSGRLLWVRIGNCRRDALHSAFERGMPAVISAFESGQRIVELA